MEWIKNIATLIESKINLISHASKYISVIATHGFIIRIAQLERHLCTVNIFGGFYEHFKNFNKNFFHRFVLFRGLLYSTTVYIRFTNITRTFVSEK